MTPALDLFLPAVGRWFSEAFGAPTRPQAEGWPLIASGAHTLVVAPTGSGKTLAAFLWGIDRLYRAGRERRLDDRVHLVYVSPLKALNNDIEKNLRGPLAGIREAAARLGDPLPEIRVAVRTGDTLAPVRQAMVRRPPHVLITTPESLYLLLTAEKFRPALASVRTVIVDEVHALAGSKRGAHLALTLERLEAAADGPVQRIGCSATVRPPELAADFLTGGRACRVVDAGFDRSLDLEVVAPVPDFLTATSDTVWDAALAELVGWIEAHRTTLVFTPSRRMAERLARNLDERLPGGHVAAHHGSLSRRARLDAEERLKRGELRALVCTSSLELGIDVGAIDLVVQLEAPRNVAAALQRVGRAGHALSRTSKGRILVTKGAELVEAAAVARAVRERTLDRLELPEAPLDVLAQQIVAAVAAESWAVEDLYALFTRAAPYRGLPIERFLAVVRMLAEPLPVAPRILWDRVNGRLHARRGSRLLALTSGGTIPDAGLFDVYLADTDVKLGTLDEEFVGESLPGDVFLLGSRPWRLVKTTGGRVLVEDAEGMSPTVPFWKGEHPSRSGDLGQLCGRLRREATERLGDPGFAAWARRTCMLDERAARALHAWLGKARDVLATMPDDRQVVVESLPDDPGGRQLAIHSVAGLRVNGAWGIALKEALRSRFGLVVEASSSDDAVLLSFAPGQTPPAPERLPTLVSPEEAAELVVRGLVGSPLFATRFRHCAVRALTIARMSRGQRTPAWLQRLKGDALLEAVGGRPDFPLMAETVRECCRDALAVPRLVRLLEGLHDGEVGAAVVHSTTPSPFLHPLLLAWDWAALDAGEEEQRRSARARQARATRLASAEELRAFVLRWQHVAPERRLAGPDGLLRVLAQLEGEDFAVRFWEQEVLPARVEAYDPRDLDALGLAGQVVWTPFSDGPPGRVGAALREDLAWLRAPSADAVDLGGAAKNVLRHLELQGASFVQDLLRGTGLPEHQVIGILWDLFWKGLCTTDSFEPIRRAPTRPAPPAPLAALPPGPGAGRAAARGARERLAARGPLLVGRWAALPRDGAFVGADERLERRARLCLDRWGLVARELVASEWGALRSVLTRLEYAGEIERGYFVEGLSGEQYALPDAARELAAGPRRRERPVRLSLADPASLWGNVFPLLRPGGARVTTARLPQNVVVARGGRALLLAEGHGRALTPLEGFELAALPELVRALAEPWQRPPARRAGRRLEVATWDGEPVRRSAAAAALLEAGFHADGDRLRFDGFPWAALVIKLKRVYEAPDEADGLRILVMRLWPRGIRKDKVDRWLKELGADRELLRAWKAGEVNWPERRARYLAGLERPEAAAELEHLRALARDHTVTLMCACKDERECHRSLLQELIEGDPRR